MREYITLWAQQSSDYQSVTYYPHEQPSISDKNGFEIDSYKVYFAMPNKEQLRAAMNKATGIYGVAPTSAFEIWNQYFGIAETKSRLAPWDAHPGYGRSDNYRY